MRWRDGSGRRRAKRFTSEEAARSFDEALRGTSPEDRTSRSTYGSKGGVYSYETAQGTRWRYVFRRTDGKQSSKRGFTTQNWVPLVSRPSASLVMRTVTATCWRSWVRAMCCTSPMSTAL